MVPLNWNKRVRPMISYEPLFRTMKEKGITSYRLGKMGFPLSNYYAMKHGENISTHTLNQLCKLLQCRVDDVMDYIDEYAAGGEQICACGLPYGGWTK